MVLKYEEVVWWSQFPDSGFRQWLLASTEAVFSQQDDPLFSHKKTRSCGLF